MKTWLLSGLLIWALLVPMVEARTLNGFELEGASVPEGQILRGGPPRDGIPAIDEPAFESVDDADWLSADDRVLGVSLGGVAKAYPIAILNWHEIVNDRIGQQPIVVTFCPLCGTGMVFDARVDGEALSFGVSGLLFESDVLLYDRETESLWSQIWSEAITGPMKGRSLEMVPVEHTSWEEWRSEYPETLVLSRDTGYSRNYAQDPYAGYEASPRTMFPVANKAPGPWHSKEWVMGVSFAGEHKAYPFAELEANGQARFTDRLGGQEYTVIWNEDGRSARVEVDGDVVPTTTAFWFAWYAFYPETEVFEVK